MTFFKSRPARARTPVDLETLRLDPHMARDLGLSTRDPDRLSPDALLLQGRIV